jgi:cytochrome c oxidase accessory protein FixG
LRPATGRPAVLIGQDEGRDVKEKRTSRRRERRRPDLDTVFTINIDGSRNFLHPADVRGRWQVRKNIVLTLLFAIYLALPWIQINGKPAVHVDLPGRAAHVFGATFTNQDFHLVFFLVTGMGFALFVLTSLLGRVWCGFLCPQTVFMEGVIRRIERWVEGPRNARIARNFGPLTFDKLWRKTLKHVLFATVAALIAHVFLVYFIPVRELLQSNPREHWVAFLWTVFWAGVLYFDFAWFREQTCLIICPYGRLQSALVDRDTVIIGYDEQRGEPRMKGVDEGGDCVDCYRCVEVCPTGIDIRNGLQMECIGCANCIDACDEVMERIEKPLGLVRYDSERGFESGTRRFVRPRVWVYAALGLLGIVVFTSRVVGRTSFQANALRSAGVPFTLVDDTVRNLYTLHIQNKTGEPRTYSIAPTSALAADRPGLRFIVPQAEVEIGSFEDVEVPVFAELARSEYSGTFDFRFVVTDISSGEEQDVAVRFRGP